MNTSVFEIHLVLLLFKWLPIFNTPHKVILKKTYSILYPVLVDLWGNCYNKWFELERELVLLSCYPLNAYQFWQNLIEMQLIIIKKLKCIECLLCTRTFTHLTDINFFNISRPLWCVDIAIPNFTVELHYFPKVR